MEATHVFLFFSWLNWRQTKEGVRRELKWTGWTPNIKTARRKRLWWKRKRGEPSTGVSVSAAQANVVGKVQVSTTQQSKVQQPSRSKFAQTSREEQQQFFGGIFPALPPSIQFSFASKHKKTRQGKSPHLMYSHEVVKDRRRRRCCPRKPAILSNHSKPDPELRSKLGWLTGYRSLFFKLETKKEIDRKISSARSRWL